MTTHQIEENISALEFESLQAIAQAATLDDLEKLRVHYLGQKGAVTGILKQLNQVEANDKPRIGQLANHLKNKIQASLDEHKQRHYQQELERKLALQSIDVTMPGIATKLGHIHPLRLITNEIIEIFHGLGFSVAEGPEVETDYYNFDALNTPQNHPARDEQDTFYTDLDTSALGSSILLRSQTSTVQIRAMEKNRPPLRIISPGRVYRNEEVNARKYPLFHQVEGLLVDRHVTFGDLKGTLNTFIQLLFGKPLKTRFRPDFFPFTEPSAELDSQCPFCNGQGCRTCGQRGWLELLGCGMVDPNVLQCVSIDPEEWSGFAFGMGVERLAMLKFGIDDIRHFYTNDLRFLDQF